MTAAHVLRRYAVLLLIEDRNNLLFAKLATLDLSVFFLEDRTLLLSRGNL